jgi:hypothetical protein
MILVLFVGIGEAVRLYREKQLNYLFKASGILVAAAILAVLPNITNLTLTNEYGKASTRGQSEITLDATEQKKTSGLPIEYATQWSYGKGETFTLLIPDFHGGASDVIDSYSPGATDDVDPQYKEYIGKGQYAYFGDVSFTSGPYYAGAIICFLFILGLFIVKDNIKWWLLGATVLSILLAWGRHLMGFTEFFFDYIPGYNKFRAVSMILVIAELTMPLLAMLAVREVVKRTAEIKADIKYFYAAFGITAGLALLIYLAPTMFVDPIRAQDTARITKDVTSQGGSQQVINDLVMNLETARLAVVKSDAIRSFFFILLAAGLLFFYIRKPFSIAILAAGLSLFMLIDMWGVSKRYMTESKGHFEKAKKAETREMTEADRRILAEDPQSNHRVLNLAVEPWQDASTSYWHKSVGGYHGAKLKRIQELYEQVLSQNISNVGAVLNQQLQDTIGRRIFTMTGSTPEIDRALSQQAALNMLDTKYIIFNPEGGVLTNKSACGNAWFVSELKPVQSPDEELLSIRTLDPKKTALVEKTFAPKVAGFQPRFDSAATIKMTSYQPNKLQYESNASADQFAVFSEIYYDKGWNVYLDNNPSEYIRVNFLLRGMKVPAGKHTIEFRFEPKSYYTGEKIALAGSILLFLFIGGAIFVDYRKRKQNAAITKAE